MTKNLFGEDDPLTSPMTQDQESVSETMIPLAEKMRPQTLNDVIGQSHLLGEGMPLRVAFEHHRPHSMILWGPPGVGKTTLARLMAKAFDLPFLAISAVLGGVKDIREAVEKAKLERKATGKPTILFVDEVHRFNKSQQDAFLPHVESGLFIFIGATTENPSFEVVRALLSRAAVYQLESFTHEDSLKLLDRVLSLHFPALSLEQEARQMMIDLSDGDARRLINAIDVVCTMASERHISLIDSAFMRQTLPATLRRFDKGGDNFYDQISALHKSIRGSDPDAALYWLARMLDGGCDARYIARRLMRMAVEDIALADPRAIQITCNAADIYERLGSPEGELALANAAVYLAIAPKSNAVYNAFNEVKAWVASDQSRPVPLYIRNAPTELMKQLGYNHGYRYPHDEPNAFAAGEVYLPEGLEDKKWYHPVERGLEIKIKEKMRQLETWNQSAKDRRR